MSIIATLQGIRRGQFVALVSDKMDELVRACEENGKTGSLTIKLNVKPNGGGQMIINPSVSANAPEPTTPSAIFFADEDGTLHRSDPRQTDIEDEIQAKREQKEAAE